MSWDDGILHLDKRKPLDTIVAHYDHHKYRRVASIPRGITPRHGHEAAHHTSCAHGHAPQYRRPRIDSIVHLRILRYPCTFLWCIVVAFFVVVVPLMMGCLSVVFMCVFRLLASPIPLWVVLCSGSCGGGRRSIDQSPVLCIACVCVCSLVTISPRTRSTQLASLDFIRPPAVCLSVDRSVDHSSSFISLSSPCQRLALST